MRRKETKQPSNVAHLLKKMKGSAWLFNALNSPLLKKGEGEMEIYRHTPIITQTRKLN